MKTFWIRVLNCVCIAAAILTFNEVVYSRESAETETQQKYERLAAVQQALIAEEESESAAEEETAVAEDAAIYTDGSYTGEAEGFGGIVQMQVVIENDVITEINVVSAENEDDAYFDAASAIIDEMLENQTADVDTISGATFSSNGIIGAVKDALRKAEK